MSAFSPCLAAAHCPGLRVRAWSRGQNKRTGKESSPRTGNPGERESSHMNTAKVG